MKVVHWIYLSRTSVRKKAFLITVFLCFIISTSSQGPQQYPPQQISEQPVPGSLRPVGGSKRLTCEAFSYPSPLYSWMKDSVYVSENSTEKVYEIPNLQLSDAGEYRCRVGNKLGAILSQSALVDVAYMDQFSQSGSQDAEVQEGKAIILTLPSISSVPAPEIDWKEENSTLSREDIFHQITLQKNLVLLSATTGNNGKKYRAKAVNVAANNEQSESHSFVLKVTDTGDTSSHIVPEMIVSPVDTFTNKGDQKAELECVVNARPLNYLNIEWYKITSGAKTKITSGRKYILTPFKRRLVIRQPEEIDAGIYECEASLNVAGSQSYQPAVGRANLTVRVHPLITPQLNSVEEKDFSETLELTCSAIGKPAPTIHWYYNGREIKNIQYNRYTEYSNATLTVENVDLPDAGIYQCFARNDAGEISDSTWLKVNSSPPRFITTPKNLTVVERNEALFPCEVTGAPKPSIVWKKVTSSGDELITSGNRFQILDRGLLIATTEKIDSGTYRCTGANIRGNISAVGTLQVIVKTQIIRPPQNRTVILSTSAFLECGITHDSNVQPTWEWFFYKKPAYQEKRIVNSGRHVINAAGSLIISGVAGQDIGRYKCYVISTGGNDSRIATLMVIELPRKPVIRSVELDQSQENSVKIRWNAAFNGNSPIQRYIISYRIEDPGNVIENLRWQVYPDEVPADATSYVVSNLRPAHYYKFKISAVNSVGEGNASVPKPDTPIQMPPQPPGSAPRSFYCSPRPDRAILVRWQPPAENTWNGELLGYTIRYKVANFPDTAIQEKNITQPQAKQYLLKNLVYYQHYEVKIAAYNIKGIGVFSSVFRVMTLEGRPTAPPTNVTLKSPNSTTIQIEWLPPDPIEINGVNQGYTIYFRKSSSAQTETPIFVPSDPDNLYNKQVWFLHGLQKYTVYVLTIVCRTTQGGGPASSPEKIRTQEDVPGEVGDLKFDNIQDRTLRVSWTPPSEINGELQGYTLLYEKKNQSETVEKVELNSTVLSYTIRGLNPMTKYQIYVFAETRKGPGPSRSADIESGVPPELPTAPYNLGITNIQARSVLLQFLPGSNGKTSITLWIVEALEGDSTQWKVIYTISNPDAREILVKNMKPYTVYKLRLTAENIVGHSNASLPTRQFETKQDAPGGPPGYVTVRAVNATALRISWTPLPQKEWNGAPRGYKIYYRMKMDGTNDGTFTVLQLENGMNMESYILGHLEEWMEYEVKMNSYNDVGVSSFSPSAIERTRESVPDASPSSVQARAISSTSINVTWDEVPRLKQNGMIEGYKVQFSSPGEGIAPIFQQAPGNTTRSVELAGLRKYVMYKIQVLAYTKMGDGILSSAVHTQTFEDFPGPPVIVYFPDVTYSSAKIVWNPPHEPNGIITGYKVSYVKQDSNDTEVPTELQASQLEHEVFSLRRETYYVFSVTAKTRLGWGKTAQVLVYTMNDRGQPDSPSKPKIGNSQVQARSVTITWNPGNDNYGPLRNYTIQYKPKPGLWTSVPDDISPDTTSHTVKNLRPNTWYQFRVAATNDIGTSNYSVPSAKVQTQQDKPEGAPQNLKVTAVTTTSINATWQQPLQNTWNGQIVGYIVQFRQLQFPDFEDTTVEFGTNFKLLQNLVISVHYEVRVLAFNAIGSGPPSTPATIYVGEAAPTAPPTNVKAIAKSSSEFFVSWTPPPPDTQNGGLSGYKVLYWGNGSTQETAKQIIVVETSVILKDLEIYSYYFVTVQAYNLAGEGPKSEIQSNRTLEGLPDAPGPLTFSSITLHHLTVSWTEPKTPKGIIIKYELVYYLTKADGVETKLVKLTLNGSQHQITIDGLEEIANYTFLVSAKTGLGKGPETVGSVVTGPQPGSPAAPGQPTLEEMDKYLILTWINGAEGNSPISAYMIQAKSENDVKFKTIMQKNSPEPKALISYQNVTPNTKYQFRIIAKNSDGISTPSPPSELLLTPGPGVTEVDKPFHSEWWFLVIVALTGVIVILVIISLLCLIGRRSRNRKEMKRSQTATTVMSETPEPEEGGFPSVEMSQSRRSVNMRNGSAKNIYARSPPRPSPASVTYSDDDMAAKPPIPDDNSSSLTEKPSDLDDSTEPSDDESDFESDKGPSSPPPPPFVNHYTNSNPAQQSWRFQNPHNAYAYTDSEADSSHYAMSLNGGQLMVNNRAGSRTPLAGFSSFV